MLIMLTYKINVLIVPLVTVRLKVKSIINSIIPAMAIGMIINKERFEHSLHCDNPNTALRPCQHSPHSTPDLLN